MSVRRRGSRRRGRRSSSTHRHVPETELNLSPESVDADTTSPSFTSGPSQSTRSRENGTPWFTIAPNVLTQYPPLGAYQVCLNQVQQTLARMYGTNGSIPSSGISSVPNQIPTHNGYIIIQDASQYSTSFPGTTRNTSSIEESEEDTEEDNPPRKRTRREPTERDLEDFITLKQAQIEHEKVECSENPKPRSAEELTCKICYTNEINVVLLPCGHASSCSECSINIETKGTKRIPNERSKCPICREETILVLPFHL